MAPSSKHNNNEPHGNEPHGIEKPIRSQALTAVRQFESEALAKIAPAETLKKQIAVSPSLGQRIAFSPDGRRLAVCSDRMIRLWDWPQGRCTRMIEAELGQISGFAFLPGNRRLLFVDLNLATLWDVDAHRSVWQRKISFRSTDFSRTKLALLPNGQSYLTWDNTTFYVWHLNDEKNWDYLSTKANYPIRTMAITPDQHWLAYARLWGSEVHLKDLRTSNEESCLRHHRAQVEALDITPDGRMLISGGQDGLICVWDLAEKTLKDVLMGHSGPVWSLVVSPDGRLLFSGGEDRVLRVWDLAGGRCVQTLMGPQDLIRSIAVSPDGKTVAAGCRYDPSVTIWDLSSGTQQRLDGISLPAMALQAEQDGFWAADANRSAGVLRLDRFDRKGHSRHWHVPAGTQRKLNAVAVSPDGTWLAAGGHRSVGVYDIRQGRMIQRLMGYQDYVSCLAFSPDGRHLISAAASMDDHLRVYDTHTWQCLYRLAVNHQQQIGLWSIACHPDGQRFLVGGVSEVSMWDLAAGCFIRKVIPGDSDRRLSRQALAIHPDGGFFAVGVVESLVAIYDLGSGECLQQLTGHMGRVIALAFSPDGRLFYSSARDGLIKVWDVESWDCLATTYNLEAGYLWAAPPDGSAPDGWLHTNRPDLLILQAGDPAQRDVAAQNIAAQEPVVFIPESDLRFQDYLRLYRDEDMVMSRIYDPERHVVLKRLRKASQTALEAGRDGAAGRYLPERVD